HGRGAEADRPTTILDLPTDIDVVPGNAEPGVEAADRSERGGAKGHVASGDMFGLSVRDQDVVRPAGCLRHALGERRVAGRRKVGSAYAGVAGGLECRDEVVQPMRIGPRVAVDVRNDLTGGQLEAAVPGMRETSVLLTDEREVRVPPRDGS